MAGDWPEWLSSESSGHGTAAVLNISRGSRYYKPRPASAADLALMRRMDELHREFPFAGARMQQGLLAAEGSKVGRRHVSVGRLKISLETNGDLRVLPPTAASHVYRIVQEGLTNINKHAHAAQARVDLDFRPEAGDPTTSERRWLTLTIENDGCGAADSGIVAQGNGFGLIGMRERVMALGGQLDIIDLGDRGFKLHAMIPFEVSARLVQ